MDPARPRKRRPPPCALCESTQHRSRYCPEFICKECGRQGHARIQCPKSPQEGAAKRVRFQGGDGEEPGPAKAPSEGRQDSAEDRWPEKKVQSAEGGQITKEISCKTNEENLSSSVGSVTNIDGALKEEEERGGPASGKWEAILEAGMKPNGKKEQIQEEERGGSGSRERREISEVGTSAKAKTEEGIGTKQKDVNGNKEMDWSVGGVSKEAGKTRKGFTKIEWPSEDLKERSPREMGAATTKKGFKKIEWTREDEEGQEEEESGSSLREGSDGSSGSNDSQADEEENEVGGPDTGTGTGTVRRRVQWVSEQPYLQVEVGEEKVEEEKEEEEEEGEEEEEEEQEEEGEEEEEEQEEEGEEEEEEEEEEQEEGEGEQEKAMPPVLLYLGTVTYMSPGGEHGRVAFAGKLLPFEAEKQDGPGSDSAPREGDLATFLLSGGRCHGVRRAGSILRRRAVVLGSRPGIVVLRMRRSGQVVLVEGDELPAQKDARTTIEELHKPKGVLFLDLHAYRAPEAASPQISQIGAAFVTSETVQSFFRPVAPLRAGFGDRDFDTDKKLGLRRDGYFVHADKGPMVCLEEKEALEQFVLFVRQRSAAFRVLLFVSEEQSALPLLYSRLRKYALLRPLRKLVSHVSDLKTVLESRQETRYLASFCSQRLPIVFRELFDSEDLLAGSGYSSDVVAKVVWNCLEKFYNSDGDLISRQELLAMFRALPRKYQDEAASLESTFNFVGLHNCLGIKIFRN